MRSDKENRVILTPEGESLSKPADVPDELWGQPETMSWREKAFELQRQIFALEEERAANLRQVELLEAAVESLRARHDKLRNRADVRLLSAMLAFIEWASAKIRAIATRLTTWPRRE